MQIKIASQEDLLLLKTFLLNIPPDLSPISEQERNQINSFSLQHLIAIIATLQTPPDQDFECILSKQFVPNSYKANASRFAQQILAQASPFSDYSGIQTNSNEFIHIFLHRFPKPKDRRRLSTQSGVLACVRKFLNSSPPPNHSDVLDIPTSEISPFLRSHPEHVTYKIWRELNQRIKITRFKTKWKISLKKIL